MIRTPQIPGGPRRILLPMTLLVVACLASPARAGLQIVNFTTGGVNYSSNAATQAPAGNVLVVGGQSALAALTPGGGSSGPLQVLFQSQIVFDSVATGLPLNTPGVFTVTGSFYETARLTNSSTVQYSMAAGPSSFSIYYNGTGANTPNSLQGTGFQSGQLVFAGTMGSSAGNFSNQPLNGESLGEFSPTNPSAYPGKLAVLGTGQTSMLINETFYDSTFFTTNLTGTTLALTISTATQFVTAGADPSHNFFGTTTNLPTINGGLTAADTGKNYDIQFQSNGSGSFATASLASVPEPASIAMTLMGLGGSGLAVFLKRRRDARAA